VHDVLGRRVLASALGEARAGFYTLPVHLPRLASGVYALTVTATTPDGHQARASRLLTVVGSQ
jgi:hypothetical protein